MKIVDTRTGEPAVGSKDPATLAYEHLLADERDYTARRLHAGSIRSSHRGRHAKGKHRP